MLKNFWAKKSLQEAKIRSHGHHQDGSLWLNFETRSKLIEFGWNFQEMIIAWLVGEIWSILNILDIFAVVVVVLTRKWFFLIFFFNFFFKFSISTISICNLSQWMVNDVYSTAFSWLTNHYRPLGPDLEFFLLFSNFQIF